MLAFHFMILDFNFLQTQITQLFRALWMLQLFTPLTKSRAALWMEAVLSICSV
jgi:hypothetical protein